ncbi:MAG: (Fe-S)-binding protein [Desulfurivibrio sp.]|nr:MAG: (Fe-S)-binding protein [Desulfurivibrio sp.]
MATRAGLLKWFPDFFDRHQAFTVFDLLVDYLKSGRIKLDTSMFGQRVAYHDPCNYGRKSEEIFGHGYFEEPRWVLDQFVPNWVDLYPAKANGYCCGGGGGTLLTPYREERLHYGLRKIEQIKRVNPEMIVVPCHSCHGQIKQLLKEHAMDIPVKYLWQMVADALIME